MSDFSVDGTSGPTQSPAGAAGGTPAESDLPGLQGLDDSTDDPDDPTAAARPGDGPLDALGEADDSSGSADPMPDMSGTDT